MSSGVQLDFSKAQALPGAAPSDPNSGGGVQLDFSKAQPITDPNTGITLDFSKTQPTQESLMDRLRSGERVSPQDIIARGLPKLWSGEHVDPITNTAVGLVKGGMGLIGGTLKLINDKMGQGSDPSDVLDYLKVNPGATDEQAIDAVRKGYRGPVSTAAHTKAAARADWLLRNSDTHGFFQGAGSLGENIGEIFGLTMLGEPEMAAAPTSEVTAEASRVWKLLESKGLGGRLARAGWAAMKSAGEQFGQTYLHTGGDTGQAGTSALIAMPLSAAGQGVGEALQFLGKAAGEVQPVERQLEGIPFTQLASELRGRSGEPLAAPRAQQYNIKDFPELLTARLEAFKQMETSLAKKAIGQAVDDTNKAVAGAGVGENIRSVTQAGDTWRYIPPDGSTSLTEPEARRAMNNIKDEWLGRETTPGEDAKYAQAYDDIKSQLDRNDAFNAAQPFQLHDPVGVANGIETWRDAASKMESLAKAKVQQAGLSQEFEKLVTARDTAQDAFTKSLSSDNVEDTLAAQVNVRDAGRKLEEFIRTKGTQPEANKAIIERAEQEMRIANAFRDLDNTMSKHYTLDETTANRLAQEGFGQPRLLRRMTAFSDSMEKVRAEYGDVLRPLIGDSGLDHVIGLGNLLKTPASAERTFGALGEALLHLKRMSHLGGVRTALTMGSPYAALGYYATHSLAGAAGGFAFGAAHARYLSFMREMASNPEKAQAFIKFVNSTEPIKTLGPKLARLFGTGAQLTREPNTRQ